jgi:A/G-specific adenine glycosylase
MLQQTQVARVADHYLRFLDRFPTVDELAQAERPDVIGAWSGLGYNTRAVRLHDAARWISTNGWPDTTEELTGLPGVGPYTAAAVASIAFGRREAAVDTNVRRVLSRWLGRVLNGRSLTDAADASLADDAASWNQAVMDLGAVVCRPRDPRCPECPVSEWCDGPTIAAGPRRQSRFEGSLRQARGAVVRALIDRGTATVAQMSDHSGIDTDRLNRAVEALQKEGTIEPEGGGFRFSRGSS